MINYGKAILGTDFPMQYEPFNKTLLSLAKKADAKALWFPQRQGAKNAPLTTILKDYTGNENDVLLTNLAGTISDGYENTPIISDMGNDVLFDNLFGTDGNMVDSNADNRADGWNYANVTPITCTGNEAVFLPTAQYGNIIKNSEIRNQNVGDVIYFCSFVKSDKNTTRLFYESNGYGQIIKAHTGSGQYEFLSVQGLLGGKVASYISIQSSATSTWTNITAKQAHLFNLTTMFPDPNNRPTQTQMDRLVQQAIAIYGYINEVKIKLLWQIGLKLDGADTYGTTVSNIFEGLKDSYGYSGVVIPYSNKTYTTLINYGDANRGIRVKFRNDGSVWFPSPTDGASDVTNTVNNCYNSNELLTFIFLRGSGRNKVYINGVLRYNQLITQLVTITGSTRKTILCDSDPTLREFFKGTLLQLTAHGSNITEASLLAFTNKAHQPYKATINAFTTVV